ncbi:MAG: ComEA family DNA-binding protein, partial [Jatrophihabitantaceae bacterium]
RGGTIAMLVLAALVAGVVGCWVWSSRPHRIGSPVSAAVAGPIGTALTSLPSGAASVAPPPVSPGGSLASPAARASSGGPAELVVDVVGKVHRPGIYRLPTGARVDDAVSAAGGVLAGVDPVTVNLARKLTDGEQVVIGLAVPAAQPASADPGNAAAGGSAGSPAGPVDLNTATATQLDALPGVGPVLAQRIVDWRTQHGRFNSVDQLQSVSGIGDAKYADLKALVTVG